MLAALLCPVAVAGALYLIRKYRVHQWGWVRNTYSLEGKVYIITGANTGLGYQTARALARRGGKVVLCCRSLEKAEEAIKKIKKETSNADVVALKLDLSSFKSIRECAEEIKENFPKFDCLINNAGVSNSTKELTAEKFDVHFGVNHLGHFMLFKLLEDTIRQNNSRIVVVSSLLHQGGKIDFDKLGQWEEIKGGHINSAYRNSKLMNFYFARQLYKQGFDVHVVCPGWCYTDLFRNRTFKWYQIAAMSPIILLMMRSAEQGAQNIIHAATDNKNDENMNPTTGHYIRSVKMAKSLHEFNDEVGEKLWAESLKLCGME